ncbi:hypothetical protein E4U21_000009 [Claviceps maximensis]|nr:hypothetical protein E4U21_000009 [Claviceps maximensis]
MSLYPRSPGFQSLNPDSRLAVARQNMNKTYFVWPLVGCVMTYQLGFRRTQPCRTEPDPIQKVENLVCFRGAHTIITRTTKRSRSSNAVTRERQRPNPHVRFRKALLGTPHCQRSPKARPAITSHRQPSPPVREKERNGRGKAAQEMNSDH